MHQSESKNNNNDNNNAIIGKQADHCNNNDNDSKQADHCNNSDNNNNNAIIQPIAIEKQAKNNISIKKPKQFIIKHDIQNLNIRKNTGNFFCIGYTEIFLFQI